MSKKIGLIILALGLLAAGSWWILFGQKKTPLSSPQTDGQLSLVSKKEIKPSETLKEYADESGFSFSYPDNISLTKNEAKSERTYADIKLSLANLEGGVNIYISDSNFKSLDDWVKASKTEAQQSKDVNLGSLKAVEISSPDRILIGALDQGVLFTVDASLGSEKDFWKQVYSKVLTNFNFITPANSAVTSTSLSSDVVFESEEVVN